MPTVAPNPSYAMGNVMYYWETIINPCLQKGEIKGLAGVVLDCIARGKDVSKRSSISQWKRGSGAEFDTAIFNLGCLASELRSETPNPKVLEYFRLAASRYLNQIDLIMQGEEDYEAAKAGQ